MPPRFSLRTTGLFPWAATLEVYGGITLFFDLLLLGPGVS